VYCFVSLSTKLSLGGGSARSALLALAQNYWAEVEARVVFAYIWLAEAQK
jgi:hypothetical protein